MFSQEIGKYLNEKDLNEIQVVDVAHDYIDMIVKALDKFAPFKRTKLDYKTRKSPWFLESIRRLIKERDRLYRIAIDSRTESDWNRYK